MAPCAMGMEVAKERVSVVISATMPEEDSVIYNPVHPTAKEFQAQASLPKEKTPVLHQYCLRLLRDAIEHKCAEKDFRFRQSTHFWDKLWSFSREDYIRIRTKKRCVATEECIDMNARLARKLGTLHAEAGQQEHEIAQAASQAQLGDRTSSAATCDGSSVHRALVVDDCVPESTRRILELCSFDRQVYGS